MQSNPSHLDYDSFNTISGANFYKHCLNWLPTNKSGAYIPSDIRYTINANPQENLTICTEHFILIESKIAFT